MKRFFDFYIFNGKEMDRINYLMDLYRKYKIMSELTWSDIKEQNHEENSKDDL